MAQETSQRTTDDRDNESAERDIPRGDGGVSDEDVQAIDDSGNEARTETGRDHTTENHEKQMPESGVGAIQSENDPTSDVARIDD
ncbi:MAG TPA: hypothetical protein VK892_19510 [Pyrinomonadaceae bacterium]|nr:hypothetical protein [Pyrinomonadaceae bacterium]